MSLATGLCLLLLACQALSQSCLNHLGQAVDWWVVLKVPPKIGKSGFGYFDSTYSGSVFNYLTQHADDSSTALFHTLQQINIFSMQSVAWNDQKPSGQTSTTMAHAKGLISYLAETKKGFLLSHSIPKYPEFINNKVNITIGSSQNYYGQHLICVSMSLNELNKMAARLLITRLYVYESNIRNTTATLKLAELAASHSLKVSNHFETEDFNPTTGVSIKGIFKNGFENCSIFEDAMIQTLRVNLTAETWGRPLEAAWCSSPWRVNNVRTVAVGGVSWDEQDDHSKWVVGGSSYACFGDMNRMPSQWKRGGSFFCFNKPNLVQALRKTILGEDSC